MGPEAVAVADPAADVIVSTASSSATTLAPEEQEHRSTRPLKSSFP
jgi:hypothetical protein